MMRLIAVCVAVGIPAWGDPPTAALVQKNDFFGHADRAPKEDTSTGIPSHDELQAACYGGEGARSDCTAMLAKAIIGHSRKCFAKHKDEEAFTACASTFCFSECGENEDCSELCDSKAKQAYGVLAGGPVTTATEEEDGASFLEVRKPEMTRSKCRVLCQRFGMKMLAKDNDKFNHVHGPTECMATR